MPAELPSLLLFLLLPVAAGTGWLFAQRYNRKVNGRRASQLSSNYFRGLNYLLSEQQDKALEVFLQLAEVNRETVETHLALGNLFRRRGETDKAIHCHKRIIERDDLSDEQRIQALLELGEDYMRAGLLDRAEKLFSELVGLSGADERRETATRYLLDIYQQEKDWDKAIEQAVALERLTGESSGRMIAQFYCELAQIAVANDNRDLAERHLRQARRYNPSSARARIIEGELARDAGDLEVAIKAYQSACEVHGHCFIQVLEPLLECHRETGGLEQLEQWLHQQVAAGAGVSAALALARLIQEREGATAARAFLLECLQRRPSVRGLDYLVELMAGHKDTLEDVRPELLQEMVRRLLDGQPVYRCQQCGFSGQTYHWLCPSCRRWETSRPIQGVLGE